MHRNLKLSPIQAPCKGCEARQVGCHGSCGKYAAFRQEADTYKAARAQNKARFATTRGCARTMGEADRAKRVGRVHY